MKMNERSRLKMTLWGLALLFAALLSVAFTFEGFGFLALVAFAPLFCMDKLIDRNHVKNAWWYYFGAFLAFNAGATWWIWNVSPAGCVAALLINTLEMSLIFLCFRTFKRLCKKGRNWMPYLFFIALWLAWEHLYFNIELSWPWLVLGNAFSTTPKLVQWYEITGCLGGSLWVLLTGYLAFLLICAVLDNRRKAVVCTSATLGLLVTVPVIASLVRYYSYKEAGAPKECILAQPNVDPFDKYGVIPQSQLDDRLIALFDSLATPQTKYFITPETFTYDLDLDDPKFNNTYSKCRALVDEHPGSTVILGALTRKVYYGAEEKPTPSARHFGPYWYDVFNSAITMYDGCYDYYHKSKLVPGVEIIPYQNSVPWLGELVAKFGGSSNSYGTMKEMSALKCAGSDRVAPMICYESVYGDYSRHSVLNGSTFLAVITNDGWWGDTPGYHQHFRYAKLRAIENRRDVAHVANTGISGFINQRGDASQMTGWWVETAVRGEIHPNRHVTFFTIHGDIIGKSARWAVLGLILILFGLCAWDKISGRGKSAAKKL